MRSPQASAVKALAFQALVFKALTVGGLCAALVASAPGLIQAAPEAGGWGPLIGGYNRTGQRLFQALAKTPGNVVLSPYSVGTAMAMALVGARGETEAEMAKALSLELPRGEVDAANAAVLSSLDRAATDSFQLRAADGLMLARQGGAVSDAYVAVLRRDYAADVFAGDRRRNGQRLGQEKDRRQDRFNRQPSRSDDGDGPGECDLLQGAMAEGVRRRRHARRAFPSARWRSQSADDAHGGFLSSGDAARDIRAIELPYTGQRISMVVMLPDAGTSEVLQRLDGDEMRQLLAELHAPLHRVRPRRFRGSKRASRRA